MNNPPEKYWQLLELALADFDVISQDPRYVINMMMYHDGERTSKCCVCLAGSVIARTLHGESTYFYTPRNFQGWCQALHDISSLALGSDPLLFPKEYRSEFWEFQSPIRIKPYYDDSAHWRAHMDKVVQWLKERDL